jgi:Flp pilus assembly protein TadD
MGSRRAEARRRTLLHGPSAVPVADDPVEALVVRSRKLRERGETRKALVLLRQACALDERRPRVWTLLGVHLARQGFGEDAVRALRQAGWLHARAGEKARAAVTRRLEGELLAAA